MNEHRSSSTCSLVCLLIAGLAGVLIMALLMIVGEWTFLPAAMLGILAAILLALILPWAVCSSGRASGPVEAGSAPTASSSRTSASAASASGSASAPAASASASDPAPAASASAASDPAPAAAAPAAATGATAAAATGAAVKPSTALAGEAELAERKGEWKYDSGANAGAKADAKPAAAKPATPAAQPAEAAPAAVSDDDKPELLSAAREGGPDDLKQIKGVGPKLEGMLHSMGVFHFDQVASWKDKEIAWVDHNLEGFKGRVSRDDWVAQAKILAAGGTTEFSKKVDKGGVY